MAHHPGTGGLRYVAVLGLAAAVAWSTVLPGRLSRPVVEAVSPVRVPAPAAVAPPTVDVAAKAPAAAAPAEASRSAQQHRASRAHTHRPALAAPSAPPLPLPAASPPPAAVTASPAPPPDPPVEIARVVATIGQAADGSTPTARSGDERAAGPARPRPEHARPERASSLRRPPQPPAPVDDHPGLSGRTHDDRRAASD